jgi:protein involved in polysaccharide export with SLBB domain
MGSAPGLHDEAEAQPPAATAVRANKKPQEATEFQLFVADALGKQLSIFGADLFDDVPSTFAPVDHAPVPSNYVLGPGDQLDIRLWGMVSLNEHVTIDRNGQVYLPKVGEISVAGVRYCDLEAHLRHQLEHVFRDFQISVALGRLRTIDVFVVGQARQPGKYTISSLSTLVNALFATGGPAPQGSLRHIQVMREGKEISDFDLYELLLRGDKSKDVPLLPGDVIYIPPVGPEIAVSGSVNFPAIFELVSPEAGLGDVLQLAGGLDQIADGSRVTLERIDDRRVRSVTELSVVS